MKPKEVDPITMALGVNVDRYLPPKDKIPKEFRDDSNPWCELANRWFFEGLHVDLKPKQGIDRSAALRHCACILRSFEPSHEHKISGVAYLLSLWFEDVGS